MTVANLTNKQRNTIAALVTTGRIRSVTSGPDEAKARTFLANAEDAAAELSNIKSNTTLHDVAYGIAHDVSEALLAAYGYRTAGGDGEHEAAGMFLATIFNAPPTSDAAQRIDDMRRRRNDRYYRAYQPSSAETALAIADAQELLEAAKSLFS